MRIFAAAGSIIVVVAIVLTFVLIKLNAKTTTTDSLSNGHAGAAPAKTVPPRRVMNFRRLMTCLAITAAPRLRQRADAARRS